MLMSSITLDSTADEFFTEMKAPRFHFGQRVAYQRSEREWYASVIHGMRWTPFECWQYWLVTSTNWFNEDELKGYVG